MGDGQTEDALLCHPLSLDLSVAREGDLMAPALFMEPGGNSNQRGKRG